MVYPACRSLMERVALDSISLKMQARPTPHPATTSTLRRRMVQAVRGPNCIAMNTSKSAGQEPHTPCVAIIHY